MIAGTGEVVFVGARPAELDQSHGEPLCGEPGRVLAEHYLEPLGLTRGDVSLAVPCPELFERIDSGEARAVIALGSEAAAALGRSATMCLPHPARLQKSHVARKVARLRDALAVAPPGGRITSIHRTEKKLVVALDNGGSHEYAYGSDGRLVSRGSPSEPSGLNAGPESEEQTGDRTYAKIRKALRAKQIVYAAVWDPYGNTGEPEADYEDDWTPPAVVERAAHEYLATHRTVALEHQDTVDSVVVESFVEPYPSIADYEAAMRNEDHSITRRPFGTDFVHSGSWVVGVRLADEEWQMYLDGRINGFSPGGIYARSPDDAESTMPNVKVLEVRYE